MLQDRNFYIGIVIGAVVVYYWMGRRAPAAQGHQGG